MTEQLPPTTSMKVRPVVLRARRRFSGFPLPPPTEEEKQDAIRVLEAGHRPHQPHFDFVYREAELIFHEAGQ